MKALRSRSITHADDSFALINGYLAFSDSGIVSTANAIFLSPAGSLDIFVKQKEQDTHLLMTEMRSEPHRQGCDTSSQPAALSI
jgi:hypothetical protein